MTTKHYFCWHCGIHPFARPRLASDRWMINTRCIGGIDLSWPNLRLFDGGHREEVAEVYHETCRQPA